MKLYGIKRADMNTCCYGAKCCAQHKNPNGHGERTNTKPLVRVARKRARRLSKELILND